MKQLLILALILLSNVGFGQETKETKSLDNGKRLFIGANVSADYCYRTLKNDYGGSIGNLIIDLRNDTEVPKLGYTAGLDLCYNIHKNIGIELGVQYSNKGYSFSSLDLYYGDMRDDRYGFTYDSNGASSPINIKIIYNHIYFDVPLRAILSFGEKKVRFVTSIGVATNILLKATNTIILEYQNEDTKKQTQELNYDFNKVNFSPMISIGVDYKVGKKINLRAEPTFRYGVLKIIDAPIAGYLWNSGLNISCYYTLN
jgi:Outer membrane protein beta-barrel domain